MIKDPSRKWILWGIPVLFVLGSAVHFIYDWSGKQALVGIFTPVNESVWEHLKLTFWPMLIWWFAWYFIYGRKNKEPAANWIVAATAAQLVCPIVILTFFYTYTGAFGIESLFLDIFSLLLALTIAQTFALHLYKYGKFKRPCMIIAIFILVLLAAIFTYFTFAPPHIPLFKDSLTGAYGI